MDFTFDLSQTPVIGRKYLPKSGSQPPTGPSSLSNASSTTPDKGNVGIYFDIELKNAIRTVV